MKSFLTVLALATLSFAETDIGRVTYHEKEMTTIKKGSNTASEGWSQKAKLVLMKPNDFSQPRFILKLTTYAPSDFKF